jgi:hypothetical protein
MRNRDFTAVAIAVISVAALTLLRLEMSREARIPAALPPSIRAAVAQAAAPTLDAPPAASSATPAISSARMEICGLGNVALDADDATAAQRYIRPLTEAAESRWIERLSDSGDLRARASGLLMKNFVAARGGTLLAAQIARDDLVQLAVGSGDPALYALANGKCSQLAADDGNACAAVNAAAWAKVDPDNAAPWLIMAAQARAIHDGPAEAAAITTAVRAHRVNAYAFSLLPFAAASLPADLTPAQRYFLQTNLLGVAAALPNPGIGEGGRYCREHAANTPAIRTQCAALAELFAGKGTTIFDLMQAATIGGNAGWSEQRVAGVRQQIAALEEAATQVAGGADAASAWSCDNMKLADAYLARVAAFGELDAMRDAIQRTGKTSAELARLNEARLARLSSRAPSDPGPLPAR